MIRLKIEAIEKRLEDRKSQIALSSYQNIKRTIERDTEDMNAYTRSRLCNDLACLPNDIVEYV